MKIPNHGIASVLAKFILMIVLNFLASYFFVMVVLIVPINVTMNLTKLYSVLLMMLFMMGIEALTMLIFMFTELSNMEKLFWLIILTISIEFIVLFTFLIQQQVGVTQRDFARFTIEHHQMILSPLKRVRDRFVHPIMIELAQNITSAQNAEIDLLKSILSQL